MAKSKVPGVLVPDPAPLLQPTHEDAITADLTKHNVTQAVIDALAVKSKAIVINGVDDTEGYAKAKEFAKECQKTRTTAVKICTEGRAPLLEMQRLWVAKEKEVVTAISTIEKPILDEIKKIDDHFAAIKKAEEEKARKEQEERDRLHRERISGIVLRLNRGGDMARMSDVEQMTDEEIEAKLAVADAEYERIEKRKADEKAELEQLRKEKAERDRINAAQQRAAAAVIASQPPTPAPVPEPVVKEHAIERIATIIASYLRDDLGISDKKARVVAAKITNDMITGDIAQILAGIIVRDIDQILAE